MASSVELGPGIRLAAPRRSRNSCSDSHWRRRTTSWRMSAMWAAGPPNAMQPSFRKSAATAPSEPRRARAASAELADAGSFIALGDQRDIGVGRVGGVAQHMDLDESEEVITHHEEVVTPHHEEVTHHSIVSRYHRVVGWSWSAGEGGCVDADGDFRYARSARSICSAARSSRRLV